ncbi:MAG: inositol monophosphatase [Planctomycetaceae bacterium]|nr:inositol monophosphatase [Planctomycetaceae bacterium]
MPDYLTICEAAARAGGRELLEWLGRIHPREKAPKDLVTEADLASQRKIRDITLEAFPDHAFLGEEDDPQLLHHPSDAEYRWIVDPLDGTTNFVHQMPAFSVSVALEHKGEIIVGVIFDPIAEECFSATQHGGTHLNGRAIRASCCTSLREALVAASFSAGVDRESEEIKRFLEVLVECQALRRLGSAALNLAYLACGRLDGYWATSVKTWDVAAGILMAREAGALMTNLDGGPVDLASPRFIGAATAELHGELSSSLARGVSRQ